MHRTFVLAFVVIFAVGCGGKTPTSASPGSPLSVTITTNPIQAVSGTRGGPFEITWSAAYKETQGKSLTFYGWDAKLTLQNGKTGIESHLVEKGTGTPIKPHGEGKMTMNGVQYVGGTSATTDPTGTLVLTFHYSDADGVDYTTVAAADVVR